MNPPVHEEKMFLETSHLLSSVDNSEGFIRIAFPSRGYLIGEYRQKPEQVIRRLHIASSIMIMNLKSKTTLSRIRIFKINKVKGLEELEILLSYYFKTFSLYPGDGAVFI